MVFIMMKLDLSLIESFGKKEAEEAFIKKDVGGILVYMSNKFWLQFVIDNLGPLRQSGLYEEMLLKAYTGCSANHHHYPLDFIKCLFSIADKDKLLQSGDTLPGDGPFTIYRGVAGNGPARRKKGFSWTGNFEKAIWFAKRFKGFLDKPMVYETTVDSESVLAYVNNIKEDEFLCFITEDSELKRVWS
jgi:hypothetical protein